MNVMVNNPAGMYSDEVMKAVDDCEKQHNLQLVFGSMSRRTEPGYNFGGDIADFYNLNQGQAETIRDALIIRGVSQEDITLRS